MIKKKVEKSLKIYFFFQGNEGSKKRFNLRKLFLNLWSINREEYKAIDLFLSKHGLYIWF